MRISHTKCNDIRSDTCPCFALDTIYNKCEILSDTYFNGAKICPFYQTEDERKAKKEKTIKRLLQKYGVERLNNNGEESEADYAGG